MTKGEMIIEIFKATDRPYNFAMALEVKRRGRIKKDRIEKVYNAFVNDKEHANYYWAVM